MKRAGGGAGDETMFRAQVKNSSITARYSLQNALNQDLDENGIDEKM